MGTVTNSKWEVESLEKTWNSMFENNYYRVHSEDLDIQGLFLLIEGVSVRVQQFANRLSNTSSLYKKALVELEEKDNEIKLLKKQISKESECKKCIKLEEKLIKTSKKALEAENRMNSIAQILFKGSLVGDNEKRNSALCIVSQMLLDSSPKRKRKCRSSDVSDSPYKENVPLSPSMDTESTENPNKDDEELGAVGGIILPETMAHSPFKSITNFSPLKMKTKKSNGNSHFSTSVNLPVEYKQVESLKKNLSADCVSHDFGNDSSPVTRKKKNILFNLNLETVGINENCKSDNTVGKLDATLLEYVKGSRTELDKIWFNDENEHENGEALERNLSTPVLKEKENANESLNQIIGETPISVTNVEKRKRADFWLLREKRELCDKSKTLDGKKLRQTKLELGIKPKFVDISKLEGFNGGIHENEQQAVEKDEDIIPGSPNSQICGELPSSLSEVNTVDSASFRPIASSTQHSLHNEIGNTKSGTSSRTSREFIYKRDAVKKKSERAKLSGWDCDECRKYYNALSLNSSEIKARMNACSRHRDKFKLKMNETPPGFWNPLFPSTEECREKGMYVSIHCPSTDK